MMNAAEIAEVELVLEKTVVVDAFDEIPEMGRLFWKRFDILQQVGIIL